MELEEVSVPGFSTGTLLAPKHWCADVQSHVVRRSVVVQDGEEDTYCNDGSGSSSGSERYGFFSNTARFARLDQLRDVVYVTEVFLPRIIDAEGGSAEAVRMCSADTQQSVLDALPTRHSERPALQVWSTEITLGMLRDSPAAEGGEGLSLARRLLHSHRMHLYVVLDVLEGKSPATDALAQRIMGDTMNKYVSPACRLSTFAWFYNGSPHGAGGWCASTSSGSGVKDSTFSFMKSGSAPASAGPSPPLQLCSPHTLGEESTTMVSVALLTRRGGGLVMLASPSFTAMERCESRHGRGSSCSGDSCGDGGVKGEDVRYSFGFGSLYNAQWNLGRRCSDAQAVRLRHIVRHALKLESEDLLFSARLRSSGRGRDHAEDTQCFAVVALPLMKVPFVSRYNYLSIEMALELHMRKHQPTWELVKLRDATRFVPSEEVLAAAVMASMEETTSGVPGLAAATEPPLPSRSTLYALRCGRGDEASAESAAMVLVLRLLAPRVQGDSAVVILTFADSDDATMVEEEGEREKEQGGAACGVKERDEGAEKVSVTEGNVINEALWVRSARGAGAMLDRVFSFVTPLTQSWTSLCHCGPATLYRQGQLVLAIPAGESRLRGAVVVPCASQCFSTLGAMTVHASVMVASAASEAFDGGEEAASAEATAATACSSNRYSATWSLIADGRSASDYIDYVVSEYFYDTGAKNLGNVFKPSSMLRAGVLDVRKRGKCAKRVMAVKGDGSGHKDTVNSSVLDGEAWSCWLDVGLLARRLYVYARENGIGQLLVVQAALDASVSPEVGEAEEVALVAWTNRVLAKGIPLL